MTRRSYLMGKITIAASSSLSVFRLGRFTSLHARNERMNTGAVRRARSFITKNNECMSSGRLERKGRPLTQDNAYGTQRSDVDNGTRARDWF